jgi:isopenicillin-N N-acyltransferase-like protein
MKKFLKYCLIVIGVIILLIIGLLVYTYYASFKLPEHTEYNAQSIVRIDSSTNSVGNSWIHNEHNGIWELYVEGSPIERGVNTGILTKERVIHQENAFIDQIRRIIPSDSYLKFLRYFIACFNVNIYDAIPNENKEEIYGISKSASAEYNFIGTPYQRLINYHGAHDLGHLLQNLGMVGCTSFAMWDNKTTDGNILVGRNFDFYVGDEFSKEKIVAFIRPDSGYCHAFVTWGGMMGAVSGMNEKGLTVTINAANSNITFKTATPVAIVARQILQYASNIDEAIKISAKFNVFVSEQFLIGSAIDNKAVIIEKAPGKQVVYEKGGNYILCTNHFQSKENGNSKGAIKQRDCTPSGYRMRRLNEIISSQNAFDYIGVARVLRDTAGIGNQSIGLGNEKAINQLIAHHSIIFAPKRKIFWVSTFPYQIGEYIAFDLNKIFKMGIPKNGGVKSETLTISADSSFINNGYKRYSAFVNDRRSEKDTKKLALSPNNLIELNPDFYNTYETLGDYFFSLKDYTNALRFYKQSLQCALPGNNEKQRLVKKYSNSKKQTQK